MFIYNNLIFASLLIFLAYIVGSISSSILLCRLFKLPDPRSGGSKNPGTTNVLRLAGKKLAALVLFCDVSKGLITVLIATHYNLSNLLIALIATAVFFGHLFPVFFNFHGGKGVATALGVTLGLCWKLGLLALLIWIMVFKISRISSLAALVTILNSMFLASISLYLNLHYLIKPEFAICLIFLGFWIIFKHRLNIYNLLHNRERKI